MRRESIAFYSLVLLSCPLFPLGVRAPAGAIMCTWVGIRVFEFSCYPIALPLRILLFLAGCYFALNAFLNVMRFLGVPDL